MPIEIKFSVNEFIEVFNQTLSYAYDSVYISGELANFVIKDNKWIYFDLKEGDSKIRLFGSIYALSQPLEDGMLIEVCGTPRLHSKFGFSITVKSIQLIGEGSIKRSAEILKDKLAKEGLFNQDRKRLLPFPPRKIGVITSIQSAAFSDFKKVLSARFSGLEIYLINVLVQGDKSSDMITSAISQFNNQSSLVDVIVIVRGGGSPEDLQSFSSEKVTRAVAGSRIPTMVAIGHESDVALAELAADQRASTPSNAAELLVPDKKDLLNWIESSVNNLTEYFSVIYNREMSQVSDKLEEIEELVLNIIESKKQQAQNVKQLLMAYDPLLPLVRGYAIVKYNDQFVSHQTNYKIGDKLKIELLKKIIDVKVENIVGKV